MRNHAVGGKVVFDLAYCAERWKEGYTNITANSDERFDVAKLYTSHSSDGFLCWNPLYLIKDKKTRSFLWICRACSSKSKKPRSQKKTSLFCFKRQKNKFIKNS